MLKKDCDRFTETNIKLKNGNHVALRFLAVEDEEAFGDFYVSIERSAYRFYCPHPLTRENARLRVDAALSPTVVGIVAINAMQHIVAFASFQWHVSDSGPGFFGICIQKQYRGLGLGKALMERIAEIAKEVGPPVMSLTVQKANPRAVVLYQKMGFRIIREQMRNQVEEFPPEAEYYMERVVR
ncbi:MAG: GNAT family N-acetyltransferase [Anaerolineales bacterium]|nr:MAG: GNAT family N-acetyltransferase [Anaerolineales bacterium]